MFNIFSSKTLLPKDFFEGFVDFHSHILHSVDDGAKKIEYTNEILEYYEKIGIKKAIFTPHVMEDYSDNCYDSLTKHFEEFKSSYQGRVELALSAEYMIDAAFDKHMSEGKLLTLHNDHVLVEFSYLHPPMNPVARLKEIMSNGYFPVLAHPERYLYLDKSDYQEIYDLGVKFQLNIPSILGGYSPEVGKRAIDMLNKGMYSYLGSDLHRLSSFKRMFETVKVSKKVITQLEELKNNSPIK